MSNVSSQAKRTLWPYVLPMIINIVVFIFIQVSVSSSCASLPASSQGECGAGWFNLFIIYPAEAIVFVVCAVVLGIGIRKQRSLDGGAALRKESTISSYILGIFLVAVGMLFWFVTGHFVSILTWPPIAVGALILLVQVVKSYIK